MSQSVHHVPGRLRIRSAAFRCQTDVIARVGQALRVCEGIREIRFNRPAASLVIYYDPARLSERELLSRLEESGCTDLSTVKAQSLPKASEWIGKAFVHALVKQAVERSAVRLVSALL